MKNLSKVLGWAGKGEEADRLALQSMKLMPNDAEKQRQAGNAYLRRGDVDEAIRRYQRSLELDPTSYGTQYALGLAFAESGDQP